MVEQTRSEDATPENVDRSLVGIGGWLILPAIGLALGPVVGVIAFVYALSLMPDVSAAGYGGIYGFELLVSAALVTFTIYAAILFFGKKSKAPAVIVTLLLVSIGTSVLLLVVEIGSGFEEFAAETGAQLVRDIIGAAIWIPYFSVSKRVKATFVN